MEHDEEMVHVSAAALKINSIHDTICLLEEIKSALKLFFFYEGVSTLVELGQNNWNFIFGHPQLFVVVLVEELVLLVLGCILHAIAKVVVHLVHCCSLKFTR